MLIKKLTKYGEMEFIQSDNVIGRSLDLYGEWSQCEIDFLCGLVRPRDFVLDIGANYGTHTIALAKRLDTGRLFSFEAQPFIYEILKRNCHEAELDQIVELHNTVVSSFEGAVHVPPVNYADAANFGSVSFSRESACPSLLSANYGGNTVTTSTIDKLKLPGCDLIKIDVEGMEFCVIEGARQTIKKFRPILFFECNTLQNGWDCILQLKELSSYNFFVFSAPAFNQNNLNEHEENIFGDVEETAIVAIAEGNPHFEYVARATSRVSTLDEFAGSVLAPQRPADHPLGQIKARIFERYGSLVAKLTEQLTRTNTALEEAQRLTLARQTEIKSLNNFLASTSAGLEQAERLAIDRLAEITSLTERIRATDAALEHAERLAHSRLADIDALTDRIKQIESNSESKGPGGLAGNEP